MALATDRWSIRDSASSLTVHRQAAICGVRQLGRRSRDAGVGPGAGEGARLMTLVLSDDPEREHAYGPANGLPDTKVGTFSQALYDEAKQKGWVVISMKHDWKTIFPAEQ
jgi:hypothetical protein